VDRRNQDRWRVVEGLAGQAHAHYALNHNPQSDDPAVPKSRPADFAIRVGFPQAPVLTFAPVS